jgi:hypothetical protein
VVLQNDKDPKFFFLFGTNGTIKSNGEEVFSGPGFALYLHSSIMCTKGGLIQTPM